MGFKQADVVPFMDPSPITPPSKSDVTKLFQVVRTDTTNTVKCVLPAQATILSISAFPGTASNAGTTAAVTITVSNNTGVIATGSGNLLTGGIGTNGGAVVMTGLPNLEPLPLLGDLVIRAQYAETGTASTTGGPFIFRVVYCA